MRQSEAGCIRQDVDRKVENGESHSLYLDNEGDDSALLREIDSDAYLDAGKMLEVLSGEKQKSGIEKIIDGNFEDLIVPNDCKENKVLYSHFDFIKMVDVQSETILKYIREGKIIADLVEGKFKYYFYKSTIEYYVGKFGWSFITVRDLKRTFYKMIRDMGMSYSYKHVLIKSMLHTADCSGSCFLEDIVSYFRRYYGERRRRGLFIEKPNSIFAYDNFSFKDAKRIILIYPYKRFADMQLMLYLKDKQKISFNEEIWKDFLLVERQDIEALCDRKLLKYYKRYEK